MNQHLVKSLILLSIFGMLLNNCSRIQSSQSSFLEAEGELVERPEPPDEFADMSNPLVGSDLAVKEGEKLFQANCSSCHGPTGQGDGPAARGLEPKPRNLALEQSHLDDAYLFWRISEGGLMEPFNSVMPAWRGLLNEEQIWQIISYLRTLSAQEQSSRSIP